MRLKTIVLTGGGTAGHVTPNIALLESLRSEGWNICYVGSKQGIEKQLIEEQNIAYYAIASGKLRRYLSIENLKDPFKVLKGFGDAYRLLKKLKPKVVFSKGGYVTVPVVLAARMLKIPVIIHESDITPGLANKIASKGAKVICVNFPETLKYVGGKGVLTGTPIRRELFSGSRQKAIQLCGFSKNKPVLLMMGGSLGAQRLNLMLRQSLKDLIEHFNIIHLCGRGNIDKDYENYEGYAQFEYAKEELPHFFAVADLMFSRAGANALAEILALKIPALLVPLSGKASRGDQLLNAASMQKSGYAKVLLEEDLTKESFIQAILTLYKERQNYKQAMEKGQVSDGIQKVMAQIQKYR
jgi:UDP-N-acetylglucosamine--N-acetylmuramyl-(pentapeptide) pyrophosphoryl-undecaprenol N-acetylglucosamine transferase